MPVELSERLSEFSYGYGVTREVEDHLASIGLRTAPFLPSLLHEASLGFDVGFDRPGAALLLQFKLGQSLRRFVGKAPLFLKPEISRPFWRFTLDTAEPDGQFELLLRAEYDGAEVYYAAPRFTDWAHYLEHFNASRVVLNSLLIRPTEVRDQLIAVGQPDGVHRVVYDRSHVYVCSDPASLTETRLSELGDRVSHAARSGQTIGEAVLRLYEGLGRRAELRRANPPVKAPLPGDYYQRGTADHERTVVRYEASGDRPSRRYLERRREIAFDQFLAQTDRKETAMAAVVASEAWAAGVQMILVSGD